jgi:hypothetical protein
MPHLRVYEEATRAIQEHKWIESEKAGRDLGVDAERDWVESYWHRFYRSRLIRHVRGDAYFVEFGAECFGVYDKGFCELRSLLDAVLERIQTGAENLDLLRWGIQERLPQDELLKLLVAVDINGHRLDPPLSHLHHA